MSSTTTIATENQPLPISTAAAKSASESESKSMGDTASEKKRAAEEELGSEPSRKKWCLKVDDIISAEVDKIVTIEVDRQVGELKLEMTKLKADHLTLNAANAELKKENEVLKEDNQLLINRSVAISSENTKLKKANADLWLASDELNDKVVLENLELAKQTTQLTSTKRQFICKIAFLRQELEQAKQKHWTDGLTGQVKKLRDVVNALEKLEKPKPVPKKKSSKETARTK